MITIRRSHERGRTKIDWLDSRHTFSFSDYRDPSHVNFGPLRVINEDVVMGGAGFPPHPHADIVSIDVAEALAQDGVWAVITGDDIRKISDPFLVALNVPDAAFYQRHKRHIRTLTCEQAAHLGHRGPGARSFLLEAIDAIVAAGHRFVTLGELAAGLRGIGGTPARSRTQEPSLAG